MFNPKKLIKMSKGLSYSHQNVDTISRRKQRAMNQLIEIKSLSVKATIYKIKKVLFENGVLSANTMRVLTEQK